MGKNIIRNEGSFSIGLINLNCILCAIVTLIVAYHVRCGRCCCDGKKSRPETDCMMPSFSRENSDTNSRCDTTSRCDEMSPRFKDRETVHFDDVCLDIVEGPQQKSEPTSPKGKHAEAEMIGISSATQELDTSMAQSVDEIALPAEGGSNGCLRTTNKRPKRQRRQGRPGQAPDAVQPGSGFLCCVLMR